MAGLVPAIPIRAGAALHTSGITGTRPVVTREGWSAVSSPAEMAKAIAGKGIHWLSDCEWIPFPHYVRRG